MPTAPKQPVASNRRGGQGAGIHQPFAVISQQWEKERLALLFGIMPLKKQGKKTNAT
jgi:hypothetical protein